MRISLHCSNSSTGTWTLRADLEEGERMWDRQGEEITTRFPIIGISSIRQMLEQVTQFEDPENGFIYDVE